ncbi:MAG: 6-phosphogluconolactonase [Solirubrobacterales bacterium]
MTRLITLADAEAVAVRSAREIAQHLQRAREERGTAHLVLSGGGTPERAYELLAQALPEWEGVEVWFADERCVGPEHVESNYRMAHEKLLAHVPVPAERVHRMEGELGPERGAERYAEALAGVAADEQALPVLDVVVLGIGPDGHVASLFPDAATLQAGEETVCLGVHDSPKPPPERITLSLAVLRAARRCLLLATSRSKAQAIAGALAEPTATVPASLLRRERLTVIVDDDASPPPPADRPDADCGNL